MNQQTLLVVDDDRFLQKRIATLLRNEGYIVVTASSGEEALAKVNEDTPDLIVLDLTLPDIDGLDVCRTVRESHVVPIVMLTARTDASDRSEGYAAGANDYLTKPVTTELLVSSIRALLASLANEPEPGIAQ